MKKLALAVLATILTFVIGLSAFAASKEIDGDIFYYDELVDGTLMITGYEDVGDKAVTLSLPDSIDGKQVTKVDSGAFQHLEAIWIQLPKSLAEIAADAFLDSSNVKKVIISGNCNIQDNVFSNLSGLTDFEILGESSDYATIDGVLYKKSDKRLVSFPRGKDISTFEIPYGIKIIGENAFRNNTDLNTVIIPDTVTSIKDYAFYNCENLYHADLPAELNQLGAGAFGYSCVNDVTLGMQLTDIGDNPFLGIDSFNYKIDEANPRYYTQEYGLIDGENNSFLFYPIRSESSYEIPDGIKTIGPYAFASSNLTKILLPTTITEIGACAFAEAHCNLYNIPESVISIGENAFNKADTLIVARDSEGERYAKASGIYYKYEGTTSPTEEDLSWLYDDTPNGSSTSESANSSDITEGLSSADATIKALNETIEEKDNQIAELKARLEESEKAIDKLAETIMTEEASVDLSVTALSWERNIQIEENIQFEEAGWDLPENAELTSHSQEIHHYDSVLDRYEEVEVQRSRRVIDHYETYYTYNDLGSGHFEQVENQRPVYETEYYTETVQQPVYEQVPRFATKYFYTIRRWTPTRVATASGTDHNTIWPDPALGENEREGTRTEEYQFTVQNQKNVFSTYRIDEEDWRNLNIGDIIAITSNRLGNKAYISDEDGNRIADVFLIQ